MVSNDIQCSVHFHEATLEMLQFMHSILDDIDNGVLRDIEAWTKEVGEPFIWFGTGKWLFCSRRDNVEWAVPAE